MVMEMTHANPAQPAEIVVGMAAFTVFANVTGQPAISLPIHHTTAPLPYTVAGSRSRRSAAATAPMG
jgi:Asp-tRNA(Asn)/Glu-tRNA(Gln) amidotransferase A subunit family amidase